MAPRHAHTTPPIGLVAIMFVDQVASTRQCAELGDAAALSLHGRLHRMLRRHITACGGQPANTTGDGVLALFTSPAGSVAAACAIQSELRASNGCQDPSARSEVRIGIHLGEPLIDTDGMPFGLCVNLAARICALCGAGDVVVSDLVRELLGAPDRHPFVAPQWVLLRGARHSTRLWWLRGGSIPAVGPAEAGSDDRELTAAAPGARCRGARRTLAGAVRTGAGSVLRPPVVVPLSRDGQRSAGGADRSQTVDAPALRPPRHPAPTAFTSAVTAPLPPADRPIT